MKKIGIIVMFRLDAGGGAPRLIVDLIKDLNILGYKVFLLNPFEINYKKVAELYEPIKLEKKYSVSKIKSFFCGNSLLGRKLIKKEFLKMAKEVDLILDIDGGILHKFLPKDFDRMKYFVWRFAAIDSASAKNLSNQRGLSRRLKDFTKNILRLEQNKTRNSLSRKHKVYPIDEWIRNRLIERWGLSPEKVLIHSIHTEEYRYNGEKKKNQIAVMVRIAPNKMIENSIKIFALGTKKYPEYKLVIMGGTTSDSEHYLRYLNELINKLGIRNRVEIIKNPSVKICKDVFVESKVLIDSQEDIALSMGPVEAMSAGNIILVHKNTGTYHETLVEGKYGFGFDNVEEGGKKLEIILEGLKKRKISNKASIKRSDFSSEKSFIKRLKEVLDIHNDSSKSFKIKNK